MLKTASRVEPSEVRATLLSSGFIFTLMAAYYILRPIRDSMASDWSDMELSALFTLTFVVSVFAVLVFGAVVSRLNFRYLVIGVYVFFAASFLAFYGAIQSPLASVYVDKAFYVWVSVFSLFHVSVFWSLMADTFSKAQAARLFGFIASGASIGAIAGPLLAVVLVNRLGTNNLLLVSAGLLLVPIIIVTRLRNANTPINRMPIAVQSIGGNPFAGFRLFYRSPLLLGIGLFIFLYTVISTFVYFELKNMMSGLEDTVRVQIWSGMDLAVNILAIGTAMFGTSRLTSRFGLTVTLILVPIVIVAGLLVVAMAPMLWVVVALQIARRAGNYAITKPGREMLFTLVDRETRFKAKSVVDIVVYRGGDAATAWMFTGLTQGLGVGFGGVAVIGACVAAAWAMTARYLGRVYMRDQKPESVATTRLSRESN